MTRRNLLVAGVAVAAASAGLGWALHRQINRPDDESAAPDPARPADVWSLRFARPGGGELALADLRGRPLLLNFWATWCPPCVEEMPLLDRFQREQAATGWQVVGLAVDSAAPVVEFLAKHPMSFAIGMAGMEGTALTRALGNTQGALPFSVIFDAKGHAVDRKLGAVSQDDLRRWVRRLP